MTLTLTKRARAIHIIAGVPADREVRVQHRVGQREIFLWHLMRREVME
jgi:hypothetical protein